MFGALVGVALTSVGTALGLIGLGIALVALAWVWQVSRKLNNALRDQTIGIQTVADKAKAIAQEADPADGG